MKETFGPRNPQHEESVALAEIASLVRKKEITPADILREQANQELKKRAEILEKIAHITTRQGNWLDSEVEAYIRKLPEDLLSDKGFLVEAVAHAEGYTYKNFILSQMPESFRNDRAFFLQIAQSSGLIEHASKELRSDKEIVLTAVRREPSVLRFASETLRSDREIVLEAVRRNGAVVSDASEELRGDKEIGLVAVSNTSFAGLEYLSENLRGDKDVVKAAVQRNPHSVEYASEELRGDKEIALLAARGIDDIKHLSKKMQEDYDVALEVVRSGTVNGRRARGYSGSFGNHMDGVSRALLEDRGFIAKAMKININALNFASSKVKLDTALVSEYLCTDRGWGMPADFRNFPDSIRENEQLMLDALKMGADPRNLWAISDKLKGDISFITKAVKINPEAISIASDEIKKKVLG